jgi:hypothetical protein
MLTVSTLSRLLPSIQYSSTRSLVSSWEITSPLLLVPTAAWTEQEAVGFVARLVHFAQVVSFEEKELFLCAYD